MARDPLNNSDNEISDQLQEIANRLEESTAWAVERHGESKGESVRGSIAEVRAKIDEHQIRVLRSLLECSRSINHGLLETACNAAPDMAAARNPPPIRSRSKSFDAACCALEQIRCNRLRDDGAAEWLAEKAAGLIDQKIAKSVLSLAKPGYQRNRGKHGKESVKRKDLALKSLDSHTAWEKYKRLVVEGFCSNAFSALLLAAEYELEDIEARNRYMPDGLKEFLRGLGFYENEVDGYFSLIRDEGAKAARVGWGYGAKQ